MVKQHCRRAPRTSRAGSDVSGGSARHGASAMAAPLRLAPSAASPAGRQLAGFSCWDTCLRAWRQARTGQPGNDARYFCACSKRIRNRCDDIGGRAAGIDFRNGPRNSLPAWPRAGQGLRNAAGPGRMSHSTRSRRSVSRPALVVYQRACSEAGSVSGRSWVSSPSTSSFSGCSTSASLRRRVLAALSPTDER